MDWLRRVDRLSGLITAAISWLALPLALLLFLQWPLREIVRAYSREANDLGQIIFALYVAVSVTAATRAGTHLAADAVAHRYSPPMRDVIKRIGALVGLVPWALFILYSSRAIVWSSVSGFETFPDTFNPGYYIIKAALWLLSIVMLMQCLVDILRPAPATDLSGGR